jgi:hypothetical protein
MGGGLIQLVSCGSVSTLVICDSDESIGNPNKLIGNPQISHFKCVYNKHTNFSIDYIKQRSNRDEENFFGKTYQTNISRSSDLIREMWLEITLPQLPNGYGWVDNVGHALINSASLSIGGQWISKINGSWMNILNDLSLPIGKQKGMDKMIGNINSPKKLKIPLQFPLFKNNTIPIVALAYHEIKVSIDFNSLENLVLPHVGKPTPNVLLNDVSLWTEYIYLDTKERRTLVRLSLVSKERRTLVQPIENLIEQLQYKEVDIDIPVESISIDLDFGLIVKEIIWVVLRDDSKKHNQWFNWTDNQTVRAEDVNTRNEYIVNDNPVSYAKIALGEHDRFEKCDGDYFNLVQPYKHHTNVPSSRGINVYSFALKPEEHQPSGIMDFSRLHNDKLPITLDLSFGVPTCGTVKIFALNYNRIRYTGGMCGLAYNL